MINIKSNSKISGMIPKFVIDPWGGELLLKNMKTERGGFLFWMAFYKKNFDFFWFLILIINYTYTSIKWRLQYYKWLAIHSVSGS